MGSAEFWIGFGTCVLAGLGIFGMKKLNDLYLAWKDKL